jgi:hypothetical protein
VQLGIVKKELNKSEKLVIRLYFIVNNIIIVKRLRDLVGIT